MSDSKKNKTDKKYSISENILTYSLVGLLLLLIIAFFWTLSKSFDVLGPNRVAICIGIEFLAAIPLLNFVGSGRLVNENTIIYNPKEWPKFLGIIIYIITGVYLFIVLESKPNISSWDYFYGLFYIILLVLIPIIYNIYRIIRDRNDYVKINNGVLSYQDNNNRNEFIIDSIKDVVYKNKQLVVEFKDKSESETIHLKKMNFNIRDTRNLVKDIKSKLGSKKN